MFEWISRRCFSKGEVAAAAAAAILAITTYFPLEYLLVTRRQQGLLRTGAAQAVILSCPGKGKSAWW